MCLVINDALGDFEIESYDPSSPPEVPLYMVRAKEMILINKYCAHFDYNKPNFDNLPVPVPAGPKHTWITDSWELGFVESLSLESLVELLHACNFLNVPALFELCCATIASMFKGQDFEKVKKQQGIFKSDALAVNPPMMTPDSQFPGNPRLNSNYTKSDNEKLMNDHPWILDDIAIDNDTEPS